MTMGIDESGFRRLTNARILASFAKRIMFKKSQQQNDSVIQEKNLDSAPDTLRASINLGINLFGATFLTLALLFSSGGSALAGSIDSKSAVGGRAGIFAGNGDDGPLIIPGLTSQEIQSSSIFAEFFYTYSISTALAFEFALGITSRTSLSFATNTTNGDNLIIDGLAMYPIQLSGRFYPFGSALTRKFRPYGQAGLSLIYATQKISGRFLRYKSETEVTISFLLGGGADLLLSDKIGLNFSAKYMPIDFGLNSFYDLNANPSDLSGLTITVGAFYSGSGKHEK
ncbi:outer membrane beta-barrel protein [Gemmatimonas aurantiaca]|nr:outer membrane beta-barrel protein [Gemmatimonas aurantiaca]